MHAGSLPTFPTFAPGDIAAKQPVLRQWKDRVYAASAAAAAGASATTHNQLRLCCALAVGVAVLRHPLVTTGNLQVAANQT